MIVAKACQKSRRRAPDLHRLNTGTNLMRSSREWIKIVPLKPALIEAAPPAGVIRRRKKTLSVGIADPSRLEEARAWSGKLCNSPPSTEPWDGNNVVCLGRGREAD